MFTISYFIVVIHSALIVYLLQRDDENVHIWLCDHNTLVNGTNVFCFFLIDLLPFSTIFYQHWRNFKNEAEKEYMLEKSEREYKDGAGR